MKPAFSIIFFTTASGAGYGMIFWLGVFAALGLLPGALWFGIVAIGLAVALVTAGLLASTVHLGHPERAWRALSQWRSSWLSREGVAAVLTYIPLGLFALSWMIDPRPDAKPAVAAAILAAATVTCTAMIYASLKPVRQWRHRLVPVFYLLAAAFSGALCLAAIIAFIDPATARILAILAVLCGFAAGAVKMLYWRDIDAAPATSTIESATGLGHLGKVRSFEAPHTEENYILKEMGFRIGRKHATKLRGYALLAAFALPLALLVAIIAGPLPASTLPVPAAIALVGILLERWLFFAEATHTAVLFYGRPN